MFFNKELEMVETHIKKSKFLSWVLRHSPERIGLNLDSHGWAEVDELIRCAKSKDVDLNRAVIYEIVETDSKGRYELSSDLKRIRAVYGHSISVDLDLRAKIPPKILYHGTASKNVESVLRNGIFPNRRQYVHLSVSYGAARQVGTRHGNPVVLEVKSGEMTQDGLELFQVSKEIWLTKMVPVKYIRMEDSALEGNLD